MDDIDRDTMIKGDSDVGDIVMLVTI